MAVAVLAAAAALGLVACSSTGGAGGKDSILGSQPERARRMYAQLKQEHSLAEDRRALSLVHSLLDYYPEFPNNDEVLVLGIDSAKRLGDVPEALALTDELLELHPYSPLVDPALLQAAELAVVTRDTLRAADFLVAHDDRNPERAFEADGVPRSARYLDALDEAGMATLLARHPDSVLAPYLGFSRTRALVVANRYPEAEAEVVRLEESAPADRWTLAARQVLTSPLLATTRRHRPPTGAVSPDRIGVLSSLTGRYALLGNACVDAALLAAEAAREETGRPFELQIEDTGGDPVTAAVAARRLCGSDGSIALIGAIASAPTVSAALVAGEWGVPLVSPTATNDRVWELGAGVFQTNLTGVYEIGLLTRLVTRILLKERFAILRPATPEGERHAAIFAAEIDTLGGEIVHEAIFDPRTTDFRAPILALRETRPEVVFVPASRDQMALVGPQLDFYHVGALVLGLSNLNNERLLERTGAVLEGVVFPDDLALFPAAWTAEFQAVWDAEQYPDEATDLALKFYQATRMLLDTLARTGAANRAQLTQALQGRLASRGIETGGPDSFATTVRIVRAGRITPFPAEIFTESWALVEGARADSLAAAFAAEDSLAVSAGE
jgi:branched-chain amino acid transport system substrate-binding protein